MLLSRVAESVYWAGRYLERTEGTARMIRVHTELYLDLPRSAGVGWSPLLAVTGSGELFHERYQHAEEEAVVRFLATDLDNPGSIRTSLTNARTNFRVARAIFPEAASMVVNELYHSVIETGPDAVERRTRAQWMERVVQRCQHLAGVLDSVMIHDETWAFLEIGRYLERADMVSRVLDVQAGILIDQPDRAQEPYADVTWMSVLRSLSAFQMFRRSVGGGVSGPAALQFLLRDPQFPRSVEHCLTGIARSLLELPRCQAPMAGCAAAQELLEEPPVEDLLGAADLHRYVDRLQVGIGELHDLVAETYFRMAPTSSGAVLVQTA
ncbi:MAG: alpha-E domain-containing protein [Acidimicrobiales bacterium]